MKNSDINLRNRYQSSPISLMSENKNKNLANEDAHKAKVNTNTIL